MSTNSTNLNQTQSYNSSGSANSAAGNEKLAPASTQQVNESAEGVTNTASTTKISNRALQLQKLAEEFYPGGPSQIKITPEFVQRLKDYGLISSTQYNSMPQHLREDSDDKAESASKLSQKVETLIDKLQEDASQKDLVSSVKDAYEHIKAIETGDVKFNNEELKQSALHLSRAFEQQSTDSLDTQDVKTIKSMIVTLSLANTLSLGKSGNSSAFQSFTGYR